MYGTAAGSAYRSPPAPGPAPAGRAPWRAPRDRCPTGADASASGASGTPRTPRRIPGRSCAGFLQRSGLGAAVVAQCTERAAQLVQCVTQAALRGFHADAGDRADLLEREAAFFVEQEGIALLGRQRGERRAVATQRLRMLGARIGQVRHRRGERFFQVEILVA